MNIKDNPLNILKKGEILLKKAMVKLLIKGDYPSQISESSP